jgi:1-deoxy-D-xylulose-5-phosphate reductoisomerase
MGGAAPAVLNAADEVAVDLFLQRRIRFAEIPLIIERVLDKHRPRSADTVDEILEADSWARTETRSLAPGPGSPGRSQSAC